MKEFLDISLFDRLYDSSHTVAEKRFSTLLDERKAARLLFCFSLCSSEFPAAPDCSKLANCLDTSINIVITIGLATYWIRFIPSELTKHHKIYENSDPPLTFERKNGKYLYKRVHSFVYSSKQYSWTESSN